LDTEAVEAGSSDVSDVALASSGDALSTVNGTTSIVDGGGGAAATSVVLIPSSTFDPVFEYGPVPYGLRVPDPGQSPSVDGAFEFSEVPVGTYKVLAALENDDLVRDPDESIAGTEIVEVEVTPGDTIDVAQGFKVTGALAVDSPGKDGPEEVQGTPAFVFQDDSSEDWYELVVHDALGNEVWRDDAVPSASGTEFVTVEYGGPELEDGMYYRFRATSRKQSGNQDPTSISRTEDLRGVFVWRP
jgi:hypothetical protein